MAFDEVEIDRKVAAGSQSGPSFDCDVITTDGGQETRLIRGGVARRVADISYGITNQAEAAAVIAFFHERRGPLRGFRFWDRSDHASTASGEAAGIDPSDQQLGVGDTSATAFQLRKVYGAQGPSPYFRRIRKPVAGSVRVALDGVEQTSGWSVDTTTGIVTFDSAPGEGVVVTAGFEFCVPMRFNVEQNQPLRISLDSIEARSVESIELIELIDDAEVSNPVYLGGSTLRNIDEDLTIAPGVARLWFVSASTTGLSVRLPDPAGLNAGGPHAVIVAASGSDTVTLRDHAGTSLGTIASGEVREVWVYAGAAGKGWLSR